MHLRGHANVLKRVLVQVCGGDLGLLMRALTGVGTPRSLQGRATALFDALIRALRRRWGLVAPSGADRRLTRPIRRGLLPPPGVLDSFRSRYKVAVLPRPTESADHSQGTCCLPSKCLLTKFKYIMMDAFTRQLPLSPLGRRETPEPRGVDLLLRHSRFAAGCRFRVGPS